MSETLAPQAKPGQDVCRIRRSPKQADALLQGGGYPTTYVLSFFPPFLFLVAPVLRGHLLLTPRPQVAEEAEKELSSIFVAENNSASSSSTAVKSVALALSTPSPSHNVMDSPSPKRQFSSASPFSPLSRAQNPSTNTSPGDDEWSGEGAELGLLAFSPERGRHKRLSGGGERANASRKMFV